MQRGVSRTEGGASCRGGAPRGRGAAQRGCCTEGDVDARWIIPQLLTKTSTHTVHAAGFGGGFVALPASHRLVCWQHTSAGEAGVKAGCESALGPLLRMNGRAGGQAACQQQNSGLFSLFFLGTAAKNAAFLLTEGDPASEGWGRGRGSLLHSGCRRSVMIGGVSLRFPRAGGSSPLS